MRDSVRPRMRNVFVFSAVSLLGLTHAPVGRAQVGLQVHEIAEDGLRIDGSLRDWRHIRMIPVGEGRDASMRFAVGYDRSNFYLAARVRDERLIRSASPSPSEDAVIVTFATKRGRRFVATDLFVFAGLAGTVAGSAAIGPLGGRPRGIRGAEVIEAAEDGGYTVEARIPLRQLPRRWQQGRISVRLRDIDSEARPEVESEPAFAAVNRRNLERLPQVRPTGGQQAVIARFFASQNIGAAEPDHDLRGNVCGDRRPERVVLVEHYLMVLGEGYKDGAGYDFVRLPVQGGGDVHRARLVDLTGDRQKELAIRLTQRDERGSRTIWQVFRFDCSAITPLFGIEIRKETSQGHVEASLQVQRGRRGRPPVIRVETGRAHGLSAENLREAPARDAQSILLPWGPVLARSYQWDGQRFATVDERPNPRAASASTERPRRSPSETRRSSQPTTAESPRLSARDLLAAAKRERGIPARARASFRQRVNLAGSDAPELIAVFGNGLVVVGPEFRGGQSYFHYSIPVAQPEDLIEVSTADVTGDGRAEVLIRARQHLGEIQRELLMVHRFVRGGGFPMVLSAEIARRKDGNEIRNEIRTTRGHLEIHPGRSRGWNQRNWPWGPSAGSGDVAPLLLPWTDRARRYELQSGRLVAR